MSSDHSSFCAAADKTPDRSGNEGIDTLETIPDAVPVILTEPPIEDQLAWHTLWPESHKLYGHGNELFSLCCDNKGKLVASSCKVYHLISSSIFHFYLNASRPNDDVFCFLSGQKTVFFCKICI